MDRRITAMRASVSLLAVLTVGIVALSARLLAVNTLPIDFDEDDYLRAGQQYATGIQAGDPGVLLRDNYRTEHPPLTKIVIGFAIAPLPPAAEIPDLPTDAPPATSLPEPAFTVARVVEASFGALAAVALAVVSPIAGLLLAVNTWSVKYSSQVMLESVPALFALISVIAYARGSGRASSRRRTGWLAASAVAFGLACAGKYLYGVAGLAILADWLWRARPERPWRASAVRRWLTPAAAFVLVGILAFFAADPYLWSDPIGRLSSSIAFHGGYATSAHVADAGYPLWQPIVWLMGSVPFHGTEPFLVMVDLPITILAVFGLRRLWAEHRVYALWLAIALVFLLIWPTKWPQYLLILTAPLSLSASLGVRIGLEALGRRWRSLLARLRHATGRASPDDPVPPRGHGVRGHLRDARTAAPWLVPGLVGFLVFAAIPIVYELLMSFTNLSLATLKDGIQGGVVREAVGGLTGQIPAVPFDLNASGQAVQYVGDDLLSAFARGIWLGGNTSAVYPTFSLLWMVVSVGIQAVVGIAVAIVLERPGVRFAGWWRTLFILPWAIPEVAGAVAWQDVFHPQQGLLAQALGHEVAWMQSPELSLAILLVAATWMGFPLWMLVATAGLRTIPRSVREAAELDGAGAWRSFAGVTLPLLLPLLGAAFIVRGVAAFNQFYLFFILGGNDATTTVSTFSFALMNTNGGGPGFYAVSAAVNVLTLVALAGVVAWFLRWRSRAERVAFA
jgi:ABC-type sugar transport system permease subunit